MNKTTRNIIGVGVVLACLGAGGVWALNSNGFSLKPQSKQARRDLSMMSDKQLLDFSKTSFVMTDRNRDGFIELAEAPKARITSKKNGATVKTDSGSSVWMERFDQNKDAKVSWDEYYGKVKFLAKSGRQKKPGDPDCPDCKPIA